MGGGARINGLTFSFICSVVTLGISERERERERGACVRKCKGKQRKARAHTLETGTRIAEVDHDRSIPQRGIRIFHLDGKKERRKEGQNHTGNVVRTRRVGSPRWTCAEAPLSHFPSPAKAVPQLFVTHGRAVGPPPRGHRP